jgi:septum formation protein
MARLGVSYEQVEPEYDEKNLCGVSPRELVVRHAREKAKSLEKRYPQRLIIGSDQMAVVDGQVLGKPREERAAQRQLQLLSGREHELLTAVAVHAPARGRLEWELDVCRMRMRKLTTDDVAAYVSRDRPLNCAGSYKFEAAGVALFDAVETSDPTAIVGLPLIRLVRLLNGFGYGVLSA